MYGMVWQIWIITFFLKLFTIFLLFALSFREENVHAAEQRRADQERSAERDLWKRWADVLKLQTVLESAAIFRRHCKGGVDVRGALNEKVFTNSSPH